MQTFLPVGTCLVIVLAASLSGCDRKPQGGPAAAPAGSGQVQTTAAKVALPAPDAEVTAFLLKLTQGHDLAVYEDGGWVVFDPSGVRLSAALHAPPDVKPDLVIIQLDFRTQLPGGRVVVQEVVGWGPDRAAAFASSEVSFTLGTFHALLGAFVDSDEKHVRCERHTIGGRPRLITFGDVLTKVVGGEPASGSGPTSVDTKPMQNRLLSSLESTSLAPGMHTVDVYHAFIDGKQELEIQLDNDRWTAMEGNMRGTPWPRAGRFTSVREFMIIQDIDDATRPKLPAKPKANTTTPTTRPH